MVKSVSRGVMRATPMSMFFSRARATASSIDRSTRVPGVMKGGVCWIARAIGVGLVVCAADGPALTTALNTAAAVTTTFFFTKSSAVENEIRTNSTGRGAAAAPAAIAAIVATLHHRFDLGALIDGQHFVHAVDHQCPRGVAFGALGLHAIDLGRNRRFVPLIFRQQDRQCRFEFLELLAGFAELRQALLPHLIDQRRLLIGYAEFGAQLRVDPPLFRALMSPVFFAALLTVTLGLRRRRVSRALLSRLAKLCRATRCGNAHQGRKCPNK